VNDDFMTLLTDLIDEALKLVPEVKSLVDIRTYERFGYVEVTRHGVVGGRFYLWTHVSLVDHDVVVLRNNGAWPPKRVACLSDPLLLERLSRELEGWLTRSSPHVASADSSSRTGD